MKNNWNKNIPIKPTLQRITDFPNEETLNFMSVFKKFIQTRKMASIKARVRTWSKNKRKKISDDQRKSPTRWYSDYAVIDEVGRLWPTVLEFLETRDKPSKTITSLKEWWQVLTLLPQICSVLDNLESLVQACYFLEGDGLTFFFLYEKISNLQVWKLNGIVQELESLYWLSTSQIQELRDEFTIYQNLCKDISDEVHLMQFWKRNEEKLPHWTSLFKRLIL